jgi:hypothetical protein
MKSRAKQVLLVFFNDVSFILTRVIGTLVCLSVCITTSPCRNEYKFNKKLTTCKTEETSFLRNDLKLNINFLQTFWGCFIGLFFDKFHEVSESSSRFADLE